MKKKAISNTLLAVYIGVPVLLLLIFGILFYLSESTEHVKETEAGTPLDDGRVFADTPQCHDSDNGTAYLVAGSLEYRTFYGLVRHNLSDACILNTSALKEYYCRDGQPYFITKLCPTACVGGKCTTCYDPDGLDTTIQGTTLGINRNRNGELITAVDHCFNGFTLNEYHCDGEGNVVQTSFSCPEGCVDGVCRGCHDTDGGRDYTRQGTLTIDGSKGFLTDSCQIMRPDKSFESTNHCKGTDCYLEEAYCKAASAAYQLFPSEFHPCPTGCDDGVCLG